MNVATGFTLSPTLLEFVEAPDEKTARFSKRDFTHLMSDAGQWLMTLQSLDTIQPRQLQNISPLLKEFLIAQAVLAFQVRATAVKPVAALGRVVLIDYQPWQQPDPPVPLLTLLPFSKSITTFYNRAIQHSLSDTNLKNGALLSRALTQVLQAGIDEFTQAEAFYLYTKITSLATGAYTQVRGII